MVGKKQLERLCQVKVAQNLKMRSRQSMGDGSPPSRRVQHERQSNEQRNRCQRSDHYIHIRDRSHPGDRGKHDHECSNDVLPQVRGDEVRKNQVKNIAAADQLVTGDRRIGKEDRNDSQHPSRLVIPGFQQVGDGELGEFSSPRSDEIDEQQPGPTAAPLPQCGEAMLVGILRAPQQRS